MRAAQALNSGRLKDAGGLRAVLKEAKQDGVPMDRDCLREIVQRRADYNHYSQHGAAGQTKPAAPTYADYKRDLAVVKELGNSGSYSVFDAAVAATRNGSSQGTALADALVTSSQQQRKMPERTRLLANFTGVALEELVERLQGRGPGD